MNREQVLACPHCGNNTPQVIVYTHTIHNETYDSEGKYYATFDAYYYVVKCKTCHDISLFLDWEYSENPGLLSEASLLFPLLKQFSENIPEEIRKTYNEARKIINISPDAFSVLIRKSLEYLCHDQGVTGKNLKNMLNKLAEKGTIPKTLSQMTDAIRLVGNIGAHASEFHFGKEEAKLLDEFFIAIVEYVYIAPTKIEKLQTRIQKIRSPK